MEGQLQSTTVDPAERAAGKSTTHRPSLIERLIDLVDRLPGPYWLSFLALILLQAAAAHVVAWLDGWLPAFTLHPVLPLFPVWLWAPLAIIRHLNAVSLHALASFSPLLGLDEDALERLKHEFTTLPARGLLISSILWSGVYVLLTTLGHEQYYVSYGFGRGFSAFIFLSGLTSFAIGSAIYYHSLRQLLLVGRTVRLVQRVNLFHLEPVYAFSRLTARTGVSWMIMLSVSLLTFPTRGADAGSLAVLALQGLLALAAFILPLRFVNYRLVSEKRRLVAEHSGRVERTLARVHGHLDGDDLSEIEQLKHAVEALEAEREILTKIPTWPWRAGTLTSFLSAMVLPIILVLIQILITKWLGG